MLGGYEELGLGGLQIFQHLQGDCPYERIWGAIRQDSPIAVCLVGLDGRWLHPHPRIAEWTGFSIDELNSMTFQDITHPEDLTADLEHVRSLIDRQANFYQMEKRYITRCGSTLWVRLTVTALLNDDDQVTGFLSQIENISDRKLYEAQLKELSFTSPLTGLWNRRQFEMELDRHWRLLQRKGTPFCLILIDFNRFKRINDEWGHFCGNLVLQDGAKKLESSTRVEDICFHLSGDEFAVIMPATDEPEEAIARLESCLNASIEYEGHIVKYSCGIGGSKCDRSAESLNQLYRNADSSLYLNKGKVLRV
jgi:diguanylate cyclase (GGDEF)-like protein/PAS domain S-box-containing protein